MALYTIHHTCGHTEDVQIYGTDVHGERRQKVSRMEARPCVDCQAAASNLTQGTPKQIAWAEQIIQDNIRIVEEKVLNAPKPDRLTDEQYAAAQANGRAAIALMRAETDARTVIDNQYRLYMYYLRKVVEEQK